MRTMSTNSSHVKKEVKVITDKVPFFLNIFSDLGSHEQLMVLYTARVREIKSLTESVECLRHEKDSEIEHLKRELLVKETERQAATISHKEALNLLGK